MGRALALGSKLVSAGSVADLLHRARSIDLGQEGVDRLFPCDEVSALSQKLKPFAVVDFSIGASFLGQDLKRYIFEPLATQPEVGIVEPELRFSAEHLVDLTQQVLVLT